MNRALLQSVLRIVGVEELTNDSSLLDAYRQRRDDAAFGQLVKRYARLVWHVCRNLTRCDADAEDAFQATFLVLARNAGKIARPERLGSWLHGVACRVCSKARREAGRRVRRERAVANGEASNGVTDSKWDQALAAVHEELAGMPEIYRLPFVLCCLEGRGTTEAAGQLGWKLGTLSGRLTRAKDLLIARLESRGIAVSAVAAAAFTVGTTNAPAAIVAHAASIASGATVPGSILYLSQGVIGMSFHRIKLLAAAIMLTGGLGMGLGTTWLANAQDPVKSNSTNPPTTAARAETILPDAASHDVSSPMKKWEYHYFRIANGLTTTRFEANVAELEASGWEFLGQVTLRDDKANDKVPAAPMLVFRRPVRSPAELWRMAILDQPKDASSALLTQSIGGCTLSNSSRSSTDCRACHQVQPLGEGVRSNVAPMDFHSSYTSALKTLDQKTAKIADLEAQIARLKGETAKAPTAVVILQKDLPLDVNEMQDILSRVAPKVGIKNLRVTRSVNDGVSLQIVGDAESVEWAKRLIQTLSGTTDPVKPVKP